LTWEQIEELRGAGWEIGAHTRTHPDLRGLSDVRLEEEIAGSRKALEQHFDRTVESFAYPYGLFDERGERIVAREYTAACTTRLQRAGSEALSRLPRVDAYYLRAPNRVRRLLLGQLDGYLTLRRWGRRMRRAVAD
jgi:peptidoglycan/xylan/chitin deacetylase (PgdA/CDA1 family)